MRILIVDDDEDRTVKLIAHLIAYAGCVHAEVDVKSSGMSARDALAATTYDLLVLDVVLPLRTG
ncbi:DNA-binding response regulator, partial [Staphylococcus aureus]